MWIQNRSLTLRPTKSCLGRTLGEERCRSPYRVTGPAEVGTRVVRGHGGRCPPSSGCEGWIPPGATGGRGNSPIVVASAGPELEPGPIRIQASTYGSGVQQDGLADPNDLSGPKCLQESVSLNGGSHLDCLTFPVTHSPATVRARGHWYPSMAQFRTDGARLAGCAIVLALAVGFAQGQEPLKRHFRFSESAQLSGPFRVEEWVAGKLHAELGLGRSESLTVANLPTQFGDWTVYRIVRKVNGLPVIHQDLRLLVDPEMRPAALLGPQRRFAPPFPPLSVPWPTLPLEGGATPHGLGRDARLVYWPYKGTVRLCYEIVRGSGYEPARSVRLIVDARNGAVLARFPAVHSALERGVYDFESTCREAAIRRPVTAVESALLIVLTLARDLDRFEGSKPSGKAGVDSVFDLLKDYYDFLGEVLGMDSFDDQGGSMRAIASVRFNTVTASTPQCVGNDFNAAWLEPARTALFPVGIAEHPEVLGHEFGHALISSGSRLLYRNESGALNESIADAIGLAFRAWLETGGRFEPGLPSGIWKMRKGATVVRDFQDPKRSTGLPNHYSDYRFVPNKDNGGVHINSSILNQGFYLLAAGGRHPDYPGGPEVSGIGIAKAVKIFGRAGFDLLTPNAGFRGARYAFALVAEILYGPASVEWVATHTAMDAIGIPGGWDAPTKPSRSVPEPPVDDNQEPPEPAVICEEAPERQTPPPTRNSDQQEPPGPDSHREATAWLPVFGSLGLVLLLMGVLLVARSRLRSSEHRAVAKASATEVRVRRASEVPVVPARPLGELRSQDGAGTIPLVRTVLESSEGLVIGRASDVCHVQIQDAKVSRRHVRCRRVGGVLSIEDLNSGVGTRIGQTRLQPFVPVEMSTEEVLDIAGHIFHLIPSTEAEEK